MSNLPSPQTVNQVVFIYKLDPNWFHADGTVRHLISLLTLTFIEDDGDPANDRPEEGYFMEYDALGYISTVKGERDGRSGSQDRIWYLSKEFLAPFVADATSRLPEGFGK